jgi:hypothetical protein
MESVLRRSHPSHASGFFFRQLVFQVMNAGAAGNEGGVIHQNLV